MQTLLDFQRQHYPQQKTQPPPDYIKIAYLLAVVQELEARLIALEPQQPVERGAIVWPPSPKRCKCADGFVPSGDDSFTCGRCGGGLF